MANETREPYILDFPNGQFVDNILKKAQGLVNIRALGDGLNLDNNGVLNATGGFTPTSEQLEAMDSGITAEKVAEIIASVASLTEAVAKKHSLTCDTEFTLIDVNYMVDAGSYYIRAAAVPGTRNLPANVSGDLRVDVIELPGNLRQQQVMTAGSTPGIYIRNSTSGPEPALLPLIPVMTSMTTPSGEVIESGHFQTRYGYLAFDGVDAQTFSRNSWGDGTNELDGTPEACFVGYIWDTPQLVGSIKISFFADTRYVGCIQCRIDGVWQTVISDIPIVSSPHYSVVERTLDEPVECDAIRFCVLSGDQPRFGSSSYGGNVCEFIVYGAQGGVAATWGSWRSVSTAAV